MVSNVQIKAIWDTWYIGRDGNMPIGFASNDGYTTLSAMITPAIFLTANASLIISTSNRVSRVVDRIRVLGDLADRIGRGVSELDFTVERLEHVNVQLDHLAWRSDRLRSAMTALYLALSTFVGTSLTIAIDDWLKYKLGPLPTLLAVAGVSSMLFASINLVREALQALGGNSREIQFYRELAKRRRAEDLSGPARSS
jgi:Protein of unknown function (DUF2721)